jgi:hypothetical protein
MVLIITSTGIFFFTGLSGEPDMPQTPLSFQADQETASRSQKPPHRPRHVYSAVGGSYWKILWPFSNRL